jgi:NAD-dependent deacetylase
MAEARRRATGADLLVVLGSSLTVRPAAYVPLHAKRAGATLAIVNLEPTPLDREADLVIRGQAGATLAAVVDGVRASPRGA